MYEIRSEHFCFQLDPGPNQSDSPRPVVINLLASDPAAGNGWHSACKVDAAKFEELMKLAKKLQHILETEYAPAAGELRTRHFF